MPQKKPLKKSSRSKKKQTRLQKFFANRSKQTALIAVAFVLLFASVGIWHLSKSDASTSALSKTACQLRGRVYNSTKGVCADSCTSGAGSYINSRGTYNYCSKAVSTSIGSTQCSNLGRKSVQEGCTRRWQQTNLKGAIQCKSSTATYIVASTDHCKSASTSGSTGSTSSGGWVWPLPQTKRVTNGWGAHTSKGTHKAIDIGLSGGASLGAKVVAAHAGYVEYSADNGSCGYFIRIKTNVPVPGSKYDYRIAYQHLDPNKSHVRSGVNVSKGQTIGYVGRAGGSSCGTSGFYHLHFSVEKGPWFSYYSSPLSQSVNPLNFLP